MKYSKERYCRNCHYPLAYKARFCSHCGQKDTDGRVQVSDLMQQLFFRIFKLESKYFLILWHLLVPGKVSLAYFQGKQKRYPPPVQFFFVVMFFFLLTLSHIASPDRIMVNTKEGGIMFGVTPDSTYHRVSLTNAVRKLHDEERQYLYLKSLRDRYATLPDSLRSAGTQETIDTLLNPAAYGIVEYTDSFTLGTFKQSYDIAAADIYQLSADAILDKYGVHDWQSRLLLRQEIKGYTDPTSILRAYLGNLTWTFFVLVAIMAAVLRLFYWRQKKYYVEHFVFLLHEHTALFFILCIGMWLDMAGWGDGWVWPLVSIALMGTTWVAMRRFYGENRFWTTIKWLTFSFVYQIFFLALFLIGLVVVFLIF
ncbi:MAG: DUF3667 domain-containing protein [Saprospiraceae bacterium]|nr:DUF3667 domain-containing protein [Saprospiraceae bacterium]